MLENYALEDDPLAAFKRRRSQLEEVGAFLGTFAGFLGGGGGAPKKKGF